MIKDEAQEKVVNSKGKNLIVSASAGSGKTTVMIRKIIEGMLSGEINIKDILVLTYTKSAAEEMKQKLINAINVNAEKNIEILGQLDDLPTANISTIHSFFQKILKKYFYVLNIDPSFNLCDELQSENLKAKALTKAMQEFYNESPTEYNKLLDLYGNDRTDRKLQKVVKAINEFCVSLADPEHWLKNIALNLCEDKDLLLKLLNEDLCFKIQSFVSEGDKLLKISTDGYTAYLNDMLSNLQKIKKEFNFFDNYYNFIQITFKTLKKDEENPIYLAVINLRKKINEYKLYLNKMSLTKEHLQEILNVSSNLSKSVLEVYEKYYTVYTELKQQKNLLDFNDLERLMLKLLENSQIKETLQKEFKQIYVDEYQDANLLQEKILSQISNGTNRFMVGDVKQSIYTFRQANPDIFLSIQDKYKKEELSQSLQLNSNFRSRSEILEFVNEVFDKIMTPLTSDIDYKKTSRFNPKADYKNVNCDIPAVNIEIIKREEKEKNLIPPKIYSVQSHENNVGEEETPEIEARVVADKISNLLGKEIYSNGEIKKIDFRDITILLSSRGNYLDKFCSTLSRFGIPLQANTRAMLYSDNTIKAIINLLSLSLNYYDDIALASSLYNFGKLTLCELMDIANSNGESFYEKLKNYNEKQKICEKINNFLNIFDDFKFNLLTEGIYKSLYKIYDRTNYIKTLSADDRVKVKKFTNDFLTNGYNLNLVEFLDFAEKDLVLAPSYSADNNSVTVTTIHASKGLEYPIVFLVNAGADFTKGKKEYEVVLNEKLGLGLKELPNGEPSIVYETINKKEKRNEFAEKLRLFYVALTRAKNHLFIVGSSYGDFKPIENDYDVFTKKSFLSLAVGSMNKKYISKLIEDNNIVTDSGVNIELITELNSSLKEKKQQVAKADEKLIKIFNEYFNYKYPYEKEIKIALKNSVSKVAHEDDGFSKNFQPKNFEVKEHLSGDSSQMGTLYHEVMQKIDFFNENQELKIPDNVEENIIINAINNVKKILEETKSKKVLKEQEFMMYVPQKEIVNNGSDDKILIQGIIDLLSFGEKNIIIDYKLTKIKNSNILINIYKTQLKLYKIAVEKAFNIAINEVYLYNFNTQEMIKINF